MKTQLIIKGAIYKCGDELLRPHFSGYCYVVDCTEYKTAKRIRQEYDKETAKEVIKNSLCLTFDGIKYFECEYRPYNTEDFELLSDLSNLNFYDNKTDFWF